jgi:hypothetical protein
MDEDSDVYVNYMSNTGIDEYDIMLFDIRLYSGDRIIQPSMDVEVQIPIADKFGTGEVSVHRVSYNGSYQTISAATAVGYKVFKSDVIGLFSIIGRLQQEDGDIEPAAEDIDNDRDSGSGEERISTLTIHETDVPLSEPPRMEDRLDEATGFNNNIIGSFLGDIVSRDIPASITVPLSALDRGRNPVGVLIYAGVLVIIAFSSFVYMRVRKKPDDMWR